MITRKKERITKTVWVIKNKLYDFWEGVYTNERKARKIFKKEKGKHLYTLERGKLILWCRFYEKEGNNKPF